MGWLLRRTLLPLGVVATLVLSGCSGEERVAPHPVELPDPPADAQFVDVAGISTQLTVVRLGLSQAAGAWVSGEALFDVTEAGPEMLIAHYDEWLTQQGWTRADAPADLGGAPAALWEGDDQRVMIAVVTLRDRDIALLLSSSDRF